MTRFPQQLAIRGSQKWVQLLVNQNPALIDSQLHGRLECEKIEWLSPLVDDDYAEYRDKDFLDRLGITTLAYVPLWRFWPRNGPQWDALARTDNEQIILLEAKSHVLELRSPPTGAKPNSTSRAKIEQALGNTQRYIGARSDADWTLNYYQYANRLAHLYLLRGLNGILAHLVFLYFVNDTQQRGPRSADEWRASLAAVKTTLGLQAEHPLSSYVHDVFVDVNSITRNGTR